MISKIRQRSLGLVLDDEISLYADMLAKNLDVKKHQRNIQVLMTQLFKVMNDLAPLIMDNIFTLRVNNFNLRNLQGIYNREK